MKDDMEVLGLQLYSLNYTGSKNMQYFYLLACMLKCYKNNNTASQLLGYVGSCCVR